MLRGVSLRVVRGRAAWLRSVVRAAEGGARRRRAGAAAGLLDGEQPGQLGGSVAHDDHVGEHARVAKELEDRVPGQG